MFSCVREQIFAHNAMDVVDNLIVDGQFMKVWRGASRSPLVCGPVPNSVSRRFLGF